MARILFCLELGGNYGHVIRSLPIARRLRDMGHRVALAAPMSGHATELFSKYGLEVLQCPTPDARRPRWLSGEPASYSEGLLCVGYGDAASLERVVLAWRVLQASFEPDVIAADFAPTAVLAARSLGVPSILLGTGYTVPPPTIPLPWALLGSTPDGPRLQAVEKQVVESVNWVMKRLAGPHMTCVAQLVTGDAVALTTFPELDHYGSRPLGAYVGYIGQDYDSQRVVQWREARRRKILVYLRGSDPSRWQGLFGAFRKLHVDVVAACPDLAARVDFESEYIRVFPSGIPISMLLRKADLLVTHAGTGLVTQALLQGVPLVMLPAYMEQKITAQRVQALGAGIAMGEELPLTAYLHVIDALLEDSASERVAASRFKDKYAQSSSESGIRAVIERIVDLSCRSSDTVMSNDAVRLP
jgi:UDP:flavonoid glycosyltransferase YjiC (YdhE family)